MKFENLFFAHRGVHDNIKIPENSILAFKEALNNNFNIELDVQLTKDNILIVFHDSNLKRMTGIDKNINELTYNELVNLKLLNTNERIPTLKDVLDLIKGQIILDIEIKDTKKINIICNKLVEELDKYNNPFIIKSFNTKIVRWFKKNRPNYIRGLLIKDKIYNTYIGNFIINACKPHFLAISKKFIDNYLINKNLKKYPILIWTIKNKKDIDKYNNLKCGYICNNIPFK